MQIGMAQRALHRFHLCRRMGRDKGGDGFRHAADPKKHAQLFEQLHMQRLGKRLVRIQIRNMTGEWVQPNGPQEFFKTQGPKPFELDAPHGEGDVGQGELKSYHRAWVKYVKTQGCLCVKYAETQA